MKNDEKSHENQRKSTKIHENRRRSMKTDENHEYPREMENHGRNS